MEKAPRFSTEYLDQLIAEATTDAYNESEQAVGLFTLIEGNLYPPFATHVLGQDVTMTTRSSAKRTRASRSKSVGSCRNTASTQTDNQRPLSFPCFVTLSRAKFNGRLSF